jgi:hypothetical protein
MAVVSSETPIVSPEATHSESGAKLDNEVLRSRLEKIPALVSLHGTLLDEHNILYLETSNPFFLNEKHNPQLYHALIIAVKCDILDKDFVEEVFGEAHINLPNYWNWQSLQYQFTQEQKNIVANALAQLASKPSADAKVSELVDASTIDSEKIRETIITKNKVDGFPKVNTLSFNAQPQPLPGLSPRFRTEESDSLTHEIAIDNQVVEPGNIIEDSEGRRYHIKYVNNESVRLYAVDTEGHVDTTSKFNTSLYDLRFALYEGSFKHVDGTLSNSFSPAQNSVDKYDLIPALQSQSMKTRLQEFSPSSVVEEVIQDQDKVPVANLPDFLDRLRVVVQTSVDAGNNDIFIEIAQNLWESNNPYHIRRDKYQVLRESFLTLVANYMSEVDTDGLTLNQALGMITSLNSNDQKKFGDAVRDFIGQNAPVIGYWRLRNDQEGREVNIDSLNLFTNQAPRLAQQITQGWNNEFSRSDQEQSSFAYYEILNALVRGEKQCKWCFLFLLLMLSL